jgi:hypothetical protein
MRINYNKTNLRQKKVVICHKWISDEGALINPKKNTPYANKTHDYEMMINDNKKKPKTKNCHLSLIN